MGFKKANRKIHKWVSIVIFLPLLVIFVSGALLLLKKQLSFIQPPTVAGSQQIPSIAFDSILQATKSVEQANIDSWKDIDRLDVRPSKGLIKVRSHNDVEIQLDAATGDVLHVAVRRSDFIESIHDGTFLQKNANLWLTLPVALLSVLISITGVILFFIPYFKRKKKSR